MAPSATLAPYRAPRRLRGKPDMNKRSERGFSLIELMVVIFILAVGLTSVASLFIVGLVSSRQAERMSAAMYEAQRQMERMRSVGFANCVVDADVFTEAAGYSIIQENSDKTGQVGFEVPGLPNGEGTIDIAYYDSGAGIYPNLKDVTVTITWTGGRPTGGQTVMHSLIANRP
jgi:prepilin-type N-terminal cleavage/methylation domain-containing protein